MVSANQKFEDITNVMLVEVEEHARTLEDRLTLAWAAQVNANPGDHGKNIGDALYTAAEKYVREDIYGLKGELGGNANLATQVDAIVAQTIGLRRTELVDFYKDKPKVHANDLKSVIEPSVKSLGKTLQGIQETRLRNLGQGDFEPFRKYVLDLAAEVGVKSLSADKMPTLNATIREYSNIMPLLAQYRALKKGAEAYKSNDRDEE